MRVFVAGASGAIGRPLVLQLVAAGHEVTGMTRRHEAAREIRAAGADALVCDVFDEASLREGMAAARPQVVVHQLTALPARIDPRKPETYEATNRLRREGTRLLLAAGRDAGATRVVAQSIAFIYAPVGPMVADEDAPVMRGGGGAFGDGLDAVLDLERQVLEAEGIEGLVLRYAFFYGPGTTYASDGTQAEDVARRRIPIVGKGDGVMSFIHVEDAAAATVAAVVRGEPGVYNVADDEPAPMRDWLPAYARAIGAKPPRRVPRWLARVVAGRAMTSIATEMRGAANAKARRELAWEPRHRSWREGFELALG